MTYKATDNDIKHVEIATKDAAEWSDAQAERIQQIHETAIGNLVKRLEHAGENVDAMQRAKLIRQMSLDKIDELRAAGSEEE